MTTDVCVIPLFDKDGRVCATTIVDSDMYESFGHYRWFLAHGRYVARHQTVGRKKRIDVYLHREILGLPQSAGRSQMGRIEADHIDGNTLDNRLQNLRSVPRRINVQNRQTAIGASSYLGVSTRRGRWESNVKSGKQLWLGSFDTEEEAAAYAVLARTAVLPGYVPTTFDMDLVATHVPDDDGGELFQEWVRVRHGGDREQALACADRLERQGRTLIARGEKMRTAAGRAA